MAMPTSIEIRLALLQHAAEGEYRFGDIVEALVDYFSLTKTEKNEFVPSGAKPRFYGRCGWAQTDLRLAGLLESRRHGYCNITTLGLEVLKQNPESIDNSLLNQLRESLEPSDNNPTPENPPLPPLGTQNDAQLNVTEDEETLLKAIETPSSHIDTIVRTTRLPIAKVSSLLSMLELKGIVEQMPGKQFGKVELGMKPDPLHEGGATVVERQSKQFGESSTPRSANETNDSEPVTAPPALIENENTTSATVETHSANVGTLAHTAEEPMVIATAMRTAWDPVEKKECELDFPAPEEVRRALLDIGYPPHGLRVRDAMERLAGRFSLTSEQLRATKSKKNSHRIFYDRVHYQIGALVKSENLIRLDSGRYAHPEQEFSRDGISTDVTEDAGDTPNVLDDTTHHGKKEGVDVPTLEEMIETNYREFREDLVTRLQERIAGNSPFFFGELVVNLLVQMGYGCSPRNIESIGRSDDGGIDGLVNEDKFGLESVYIQAKWREETVDQSEVQKLALALRQHQTRKGIFITPSKFSEDAREYVNAIDSKIVLIDGHQLAEYMIDLNIGVSVVKSYEIKRVDSDYFIETDDSQTQDS